MGAATLVAIFLPSVSQSIYFHRKEVVTRTSSTSGENQELGNPTAIRNDLRDEIILPNYMSRRQQCRNAFTYLYEDFKHAFTNSYVIKWSIWWAIATCGYLQVTSYAQLLWQDIIHNDPDEELYHGFVEFGYSLLDRKSVV